MSIFYLGILSGRAGGVRLTRRAGRAVPLLWASLAATTAGFVLFWLAVSPAPAIAGLFLCGLGIANLYPLSLALTLDAAPGHGDTANARVQLLGGVLVIVAPTSSAAWPTSSGCAPRSPSSRCSSEPAGSFSWPGCG